MADNVIKVSVTSTKSQRVNVSSSQVATNITASPDLGLYWSQKAKNWAVSENIVDNEDYSSKHYANVSKNHAENAKNYLDTTIENYNNFIDKSSDALGQITELKDVAIEDINSTKTTILSDIEFVADGEKQEIQELSEEAQNKIINLGIDTRANKDLSNLSEDGEKHFLNKSQITNCITEIPQRIKYTLENGVFTLKAGSVVIVPYGVEDLTSQYPVGSKFMYDDLKVYDTQYRDGKFFVWAELIQDKSHPITYVTATNRFIMLNNEIIDEDYSNLDTNIQLGGIQADLCLTSTSMPTANRWYYNPDTNKFYQNYSGIVYERFMSFPVALGSYTRDYGFNNIDEIYNGSGYFGITFWCDKDVKGLIPDGRNTDGSLKNIEFTLDHLTVINGFNGLTNDTVVRRCAPLVIYYGSEKVDWWIDNRIFNQETEPISTENFLRWYKPSANEWYERVSLTDSWVKIYPIIYTQVSWDGSTIDALKSKLPFRAVDYSHVDGQWVSKAFTVTESITANMDKTFDISSYLPIDGYNYEVIINGYGNTGTTSGDSLVVSVGTDIITSLSFLICCRTRTASGVNAGSTMILPVGSRRSLQIKNGGTKATSGNITLRGYRRIGTNA